MFDYIDFSSLNNENDIITPSYKNQLFFRDQLTNYMIRNNNIKHPIIYGRDNWDRLFITIYCYQNKKKKYKHFFNDILNYIQEKSGYLEIALTQIKLNTFFL